MRKKKDAIEDIAERIMIKAYSNGNKISYSELDRIIRPEDDRRYAIDKILLQYGGFYSQTLDGKEGDYVLSEQGQEFASAGCYSGRRRKERWNLFFKWAGLIATIISATIALIKIFL